MAISLWSHFFGRPCLLLLRKQVNNCELLTVGCCSLPNVLGQLLVFLSDLAVLFFSVVMMQMCILLYYLANKMTMMMNCACSKCTSAVGTLYSTILLPAPVMSTDGYYLNFTSLSRLVLVAKRRKFVNSKVLLLLKSAHIQCI